MEGKFLKQRSRFYEVNNTIVKKKLNKRLIKYCQLRSSEENRSSSKVDLGSTEEDFGSEEDNEDDDDDLDDAIGDNNDGSDSDDDASGFVLTLNPVFSGTPTQGMYILAKIVLPAPRKQCFSFFVPFSILNPHLQTTTPFYIQGDQLNMAVCFWYFVKSELLREQVYCSVHQTSHFIMCQENTAMFI